MAHSQSPLLLASWQRSTSALGLVVFMSVCNAANNGRLMIVGFVKQWRSHAQKAQAQGCPRSVATDVAWPC